MASGAPSLVGLNSNSWNRLSADLTFMYARSQSLLAILGTFATLAWSITRRPFSSGGLVSTHCLNSWTNGMIPWNQYQSMKVGVFKIVWVGCSATSPPLGYDPLVTMD